MLCMGRESVCLSSGSCEFRTVPLRNGRRILVILVLFYRI